MGKILSRSKRVGVVSSVCANWVEITMVDLAEVEFGI